jgi:hypothetical protein
MKTIIFIISILFSSQIFACPEGYTCKAKQICENVYQGSICYEVKEITAFDKLVTKLVEFPWLRAYVAAFKMILILGSVTLLYWGLCYLYGCYLWFFDLKQEEQ